MQFRRPTLLHFLAVVIAFLACGAGEVQARRRGITIITSGTTHSELGSVKKENVSGLAPEMQAEIRERNYDTVGYQYSHFGIFWLDLWNWNGEYIVYNKVSEDGAIAPPGVAAALMGVAENKLPKPLNYRCPFGLLVLCGLVSLKFAPRLLAKRSHGQQGPSFMPTRKESAERPRWTPMTAPPVPPQPHSSPAVPPQGSPPPIPPPLPPAP